MTPTPRTIALRLPAAEETALPLHERISDALGMVSRAFTLAQTPVKLVMGDGEYPRPLRFPFYGNEVQRYPAKTTAMLLALMATLQQRLAQGTARSTVRDLYYSNVQLYGDQSQVERTLGLISGCLGLRSRQELMVVPAQKGLVFTTFSCTVSGTIIQPNSIELIPYMHDGIFEIGNCAGPVRVTVFEKEAVFNRVVETLSSAPLCAPHILVTGKGYPDGLTKKFLANLIRWGDASPTSVLIELYVDADPDGAAIALNYIDYCGAQNIDYKGTTLPQLIARRTQLLDLTQRELQMAINMLSRRRPPLAIATQLQRQLFFHKKGEMNACYVHT